MKFKYKFSTLFYVLFSLCIVLAGVCLVWNAIKLADALQSEIALSPFNLVSLIICIIVPVVFAVIVVSIWAKSYYEIDEKSLTVKFGFFKEVYPSDSIDRVIKNVKLNLLTVVFKNESSYKIVISPTAFDEFSSALIKTDKNILYGETDN